MPNLLNKDRNRTYKGQEDDYEVIQRTPRLEHVEQRRGYVNWPKVLKKTCGPKVVPKDTKCVMVMKRVFIPKEQQKETW